jgi:hypothetical protein
MVRYSESLNYRWPGKEDTLIEVRVKATDNQAVELHNRLNNAGLIVSYLEEQHGPDLIVSIHYDPIHKPSLMVILGELGLTTTDQPD